MNARKVTSKEQELPAASVATTDPDPSRGGAIGWTRQVAVGVGDATDPQAAGNGALHTRLTLVALASVMLEMPVSKGAESVDSPSKPSTPSMIDLVAVQIGSCASIVTQVRLSSPKFLKPLCPPLPFTDV